MTAEKQAQVFVDYNKKGKDRKWRERKLNNIKLADSFEKLNYRSNFVQRIRQCAEVLTFVRDEQGLLHLNQAWFCKNKLCPICNWRRALKYSKKEAETMKDYIKKNILWILFVFVTSFLCSNQGLYHLTHQTISLDGCIWGIPLFLFQVLFIDKFFISKK